jgi:hypothetical protein
MEQNRRADEEEYVFPPHVQRPITKTYMPSGTRVESYERQVEAQDKDITRTLPLD